MCEAKNADYMQLDMKMNRLTRITDGLQKDVSDIWTYISTSGIEKVQFGNKTRTDTNNFMKVRTDVDNTTENRNFAMDLLVTRTVSEVKELKTEVEELILYARNGFQNEKEFQREAINALNRSSSDIQTDIMEENANINQNIENLNKQITKSQETSDINGLRIDTLSQELKEQIINTQETSSNVELRIDNLSHDLQETVKDAEEKGVLIESMKKMIETLSEKQTVLEMKNQMLEQTIGEMKEGSILSKTKEGSTEPTVSVSCEDNWAQFEGHCYLYYDIKKYDWFNADSMCWQKGGYLVEITSQPELEFVTGLAQGSERIWTGGTDIQGGHKGPFVYDHSKEAIPTQFWARGEPNTSRNQHCVYMHLTGGQSVFKVYGCKDWWYSDNTFVCEKPGTLIAN